MLKISGDTCFPHPVYMHYIEKMHAVYSIFLSGDTLEQQKLNAINHEHEYMR